MPIGSQGLTPTDLDAMDNERLAEELSKAKAELFNLRFASATGQLEDHGHRKVRRGYVLSDKMDKTVVVEVEERYTHSLYGKVLRRSKKVKVHDEHNEAHPGDLVQIMETRPLSATKHWRLVEIIEKAK